MRGRRLKLGLLLATGTAALVAAGPASAGLFVPKQAITTLVFGAEADATYLDPAIVSDGPSFRIAAQVFEGLVALTPGKTSVQPRLATRWTTSRDGRTWTFTLRRGVRFHDGTRFNAAAVCFNFNRQYNFRGAFQDASATYYWQTVFLGYWRNEDPNLSPSLYQSCTARGQYTAVIRLRKPYGPFASALGIPAFFIQSPTALRRFGADRGELRGGTFYPLGSYAFSHPTGTGPFRFQSWTIGERLVLVRNDRYWGKKPRLRTVIIRPIPNNTARLQALQTGEVSGYDLVAPEHVDNIRQNSTLKVLDRPAFNVAYVTIHQGPGSPMNDIRVRQAVAYGLDRAGVVRSAIYSGRAQVAHEFQPPQLFGWTNKVPKYTYNPTRARQLLNASNCKVPCRVEFWWPTNVSRPYMPDPRRIFEAFSASLERAGFNVVARSAPWRPDYVKKVNEGTAGDLNMIGWIGDFGDPDNFVGTFFKTYAPQFGFRNARIQGLLARAAAETNFKRRVALYQRANIEIMRVLPAVPYAHARAALGFQRRVLGFVASPVAGSEPFQPVYYGGR